MELKFETRESQSNPEVYNSYMLSRKRKWGQGIRNDGTLLDRVVGTGFSEGRQGSEPWEQQVQRPWGGQMLSMFKECGGVPLEWREPGQEKG